MRRILGRGALCAVTGLLLLSAAEGAPVRWSPAVGGNGHWYEAVVASPGPYVSFTDAKSDAAARLGHLATIGSYSENLFAYGLVDKKPQFWHDDAYGNGIGPWLGAWQPPPRTAEPAGGWVWITGEVWSYTRWSPGEPNNMGNNEHYLHFFAPGGGWNSYWNDLAEAAWSKGYIVEWTYLPGDADRNGIVDMVDYKIWFTNYGVGTTWPQANFKGYGVTDMADYKFWFDYYGTGPGPVPEPASLALLVVGGMALLPRRGEK